MVYYYTSGNVKMLRNIIMDYAASAVSPYEYMKAYIEKCPENTEDAKISWITESFLGIQRHDQFLKEIALYVSEELTGEDQDYFMIILHAVIFQIEPKVTSYFYKCLFNLSKPLLNTFTKFFSSEILPLISQIAQTTYDTNFITNKIINPLFTWQPHISEMAHNYSEYLKKLESRKKKPPTIPIQPNVLNRKCKEFYSPVVENSLPATPPNSMLVKSKKMLTKSVIDQRLKYLHEKNQQKASQLLNDAKNNNFHYAQAKSSRYYKNISSIRDEIENEITKVLSKPNKSYNFRNSHPPVKETTATLKRINKRIQLAEEEEVEWLQTLMITCRNTTKFEELQEHARQEKERKRLFDIERKHLMGQISYEEAVIAKKKIQDANKKNYEKFLKEKEMWSEEIERWKKIEMDKNRKQIEKLSMLELNLINAKNDILAKKKATAYQLKKESEILLEKAMKEKQEELEQKVTMIKEIKILDMIAKKAKLSRIIDLTETSGLGLLCEMSMAELQERLSSFKIRLQEELESKRRIIMEQKTVTKQELENTKIYIKNYMTQRSLSRKQNIRGKVTFESASSKEINDLKKILEEKRKLRIKLTNQN
ncbi:cilia- and flagella-associated protein 99-like [Galleria mellonella]|uniref:Cilia- and flagella-associated protein 99-like n=1 Tax=Galleria mellonella TaxID=7137 RepID=A0A6J1X9P9_GALME|nr:cilia- and flagella-associated protein 99-like [Galleria mellonella]